MRLFLPSDYQPKYAYPLVVLFHADGGDEDAAARLVPHLSRRNYIAACPRGPVSLGLSATGRPGFAWGDDPRADEYLLATVAHARREYHVHSERVYLIGVGEGAAAAYRLGLAMAGDGGRRRRAERPHAEDRRADRCSGLNAMRDLRVFIGHGASNPVVPVACRPQAVAPACLGRRGRPIRSRTRPRTASTPTCSAT